MSKAKEIKLDVTTKYFACREYLSATTVDPKLVESAKMFCLDVEEAVKGIDESMSDEEIADYFITVGLYPVTNYFK